MISNQRVLAIIPARGGSKGIHRKNIRMLAGKPLIAWTLAAAQESTLIDRCVVSTDDPEIADIAKKWGADIPFMRPAALANDTATAIDTIFHAITTLGESYDIVVYLQPTSPLRRGHDIDATLDKMVRNHAPACVTTAVCDKPPQWMYTLAESGRLKPVIAAANATARQQLPQFYALNGAVYAATIPWLNKIKSFVNGETVTYVMPAESSVDIDTEHQFNYCQHLLVEQSQA